MAFAVNLDGTVQIPDNAEPAFAADCKCCDNNAGTTDPCGCKMPSTVNLTVNAEDECEPLHDTHSDGWAGYRIHHFSSVTGGTLARVGTSCVFRLDVSYNVDTYGFSSILPASTTPEAVCAHSATLVSTESVTSEATVTFGATGGRFPVVGVVSPGFDGTLSDICCRASYDLDNAFSTGMIPNNPGGTATVSGLEAEDCPCDGCCRELQVVIANTPDPIRFTLEQTHACHYFGTFPGTGLTVYVDLTRTADNHWSLRFRNFNGTAFTSECTVTSDDTSECPDGTSWPAGSTCARVLCIFCGDETADVPDGCISVPCPTDCTACCDAGEAIIAGGTGSGPDASGGYNGDWFMLSTTADSCQWDNGDEGGRTVVVTCTGSVWHARANAAGTPTPYIEWTAPNDDTNCPFGLTWTLVHNGFDAATPTFVMNDLCGGGGSTASDFFFFWD